MNTMKSFTDIDGRLVSVTTSFEYPPTPSRTFDYCAWYSAQDGNEERNYGWGVTREEAIIDLITSYADPDEPTTFAEEYDEQLFSERLAISAYEFLYFQEYR